MTFCLWYLAEVNLGDFVAFIPSAQTHLTKSDSPLTCLCCFSHSLGKHPSREWDDVVDTEREWHSGGSGYLSRAHSSTSLQVGQLGLSDFILCRYVKTCFETVCDNRMKFSIKSIQKCVHCIKRLSLLHSIIHHSGPAACALRFPPA